MSDQLQQIGQRLKGLRESLDLSVAEIAKRCKLAEEEYAQYEAGLKDVSVGVLNNLADEMGVALSVLLFGEEPKMNAYFVTRKGQGLKVERVKAYSYQCLAAGFISRKVQPFMVSVEAKGDEVPFNLSSHEGQEFNMVIEGRMHLRIAGKDIVLEEGDSIYFDSSYPHGMKALDNKPVRFLAVVI